MISSATLVSWLDLLSHECVRYPRVQVEDVYKFVHQGCCGPGHAVQSRDEATCRLQVEWNAVRARSDEPLSTRLDPHGRYVRLHLRPYRNIGGSLSLLLDAFLQSAHTVDDSAVEELQHVWTAIARAWDTRDHPCRSAAPHITAQQLATFGDVAASHGWGARHHSDVYRAGAAPAYRVIRTELIGGVLAGLSAVPE